MQQLDQIQSRKGAAGFGHQREVVNQARDWRRQREQNSSSLPYIRESEIGMSVRGCIQNDVDIKLEATPRAERDSVRIEALEKVEKMRVPFR